MSIIRGSKINWLISNWTRELIYTQTYLNKLGYPPNLIQKYKQSEWLVSLGSGAYIKKNDSITWQGGLAAIQSQLHRPIHAGGKTALALQGISHYAVMGTERIHLFGLQCGSLPKWYSTCFKDQKFSYYCTQFLETAETNSFTKISVNELNIRVSTRERAIFEVLHRVPQVQGFDEAYKLLEMLSSLLLRWSVMVGV